MALFSSGAAGIRSRRAAPGVFGLAVVGFGALGVSACGGEPAPEVERQPLAVEAVPRGHDFEGMTTVQLMASRPAQIFYTLGGEDPIGPRAQLYTAPLQLDRTTLVTFVAASEDGIWSLPVSELYAPLPEEKAPDDVVLRGLRLDSNNHFFAAQPSSGERLTTVFTIRSVGLDAVHVSSVRIGVNPRGSNFFEDGVFRIDGDLPEPLTLEPGTSVAITVSYAPTNTLRSAVLVIESDDQRATDGLLLAELWGRIFTW